MLGYLLLWIVFGLAGYVAGVMFMGPGAAVPVCVVTTLVGMYAFHP